MVTVPFSSGAASGTAGVFAASSTASPSAAKKNVGIRKKMKTNRIEKADFAIVLMDMLGFFVLFIFFCIIFGNSHRKSNVFTV
ncbi:MAG: hypothetical protein Ta2A_09780 [Treponemataceae bacterium]|nr:MAG: hypothetical protein Ta2A_09780 [Treponemataceae bacterium]